MPTTRKPLRPTLGCFREITSCHDGRVVGWSIYPDELPALTRRQVSAVATWLAIRVPLLPLKTRAGVAAGVVAVALRAAGLPVPAPAARRSAESSGGSR